MAKKFIIHLALICICAGVRPVLGQCEVETARTQLHVREATGKNDGPEVAKFLASVGIKFPAPWCGGFGAWVLSKCGIEHKMNGMASSCCPNDDGLLYKRGRNKSQPDEVPAGTMFFWSRPEGGHTGFVTEWGDGDYFTRIDGNTSTADGGQGVAEKKALKRNVQKLYKYQEPEQKPVEVAKDTVISNVPVQELEPEKQAENTDSPVSKTIFLTIALGALLALIIRELL